MAVLFGTRRGDSSDDDSVPDLSTWKSNTLSKAASGNPALVAQMTEATRAPPAIATDSESESDGQKSSFASNVPLQTSRSAFKPINTPARRRASDISTTPESGTSESVRRDRQDVDSNAVIEIVGENIDRSEYEDLSGGRSRVRCVLCAVTDDDDNTLYEVAFGNYLVDQVSCVVPLPR
jgi:hypothetical protein